MRRYVYEAVGTYLGQKRVETIPVNAHSKKQAEEKARRIRDRFHPRSALKLIKVEKMEE